MIQQRNPGRETFNPNREFFHIDVCDVGEL